MADSDLQFIAPNYLLKAKAIPPLLPTDNLTREPINSSTRNDPQDLLIFVVVLLALLCLGRLWSLLLMLQLVTNIDNFSKLVIPADARMVLDVLERIANVRVTSITVLKEWMDSTGISRVIIFNQNEELLLSLEVFPVLIGVVALMGKACEWKDA